MIASFKYFWYILRHKWYVFIECCKLGIPFRGIVHDFSKFYPSEFFPYRDRFFVNKNSDVFRDAFEKSFTRHWLRNPHHWQSWGGVLYDFKKEDIEKNRRRYRDLRQQAKPNKFAIEIPMPYLKEMLADWLAMSKTVGKHKGDTIGWYRSQKHTMIMHDRSRAWLEHMIGYHEVSNEQKD